MVLRAIACLKKRIWENANSAFVSAMRFYEAAKLCYLNAGKQDSMLIVENQMSTLFGQIAETLQAKEKKSSEAGLISTLNEVGTTYYDFANEIKKDEYLAYPPSPNDIFIAFGVANKIKLKAFPNALPAEVVSTSLEVVDSDALLPVTLGYRYQRSQNGYFFSTQLQYQREQLLETIEAEAAINQQPYQVRRFMDMDVWVLIAGAGKSFGNFHLFAGLENTFLYSQYQPISTFVFSDQDALETVLPDVPLSNLSDNQIEIEQEQQRVATNYLNLSLFWQVSYRFPIGDNLFLSFQASNILPVAPSLLYRLTDISFSTDSLWQDFYAVDYKAIRVKSINYLQIQLGYHFNREKRIKSRLQLY